MCKTTRFIGIDIAKNTFDVNFGGKRYDQFENNPKGFKAFANQLNHNDWCVMEATGSYHHKLAHFLFDHYHQLSVVNPLIIKRFIQMKMHHFKTDKADAYMIALYGDEQKPTPWKPRKTYLLQCQQIESVIELYTRQSTALQNKIHNLKTTLNPASSAMKSLKLQLKRLKAQTHLLEKELESTIKQHEPELFSNIKSIPGIGPKTASKLIVSTAAFSQFDNAKQVIAFCGLSPVERTSGSSIKGRARISKKGYVSMRNNLFLCSFTASQCNPQCKALFDRITAKGKSKKLALIAVSNKLIKQAFAIAKAGIPYDPEFRSTIPNNQFSFGKASPN